MDIVTGKSIYEHLLPAEAARKILKIFCRYDTLKEIYFDGVGYVNRLELENISHFMPDKPMADYISATRVPVEDVWEKFELENRGLDKMQGIFAYPEEREPVRKELEDIPDIEVTGSLAVNLEINAGGVNKGRALLRLGEILGIVREEIMAFGDASNDLQMIVDAGTGVAMANGSEEIKDIADYVAFSNDAKKALPDL